MAASAKETDPVVESQPEDSVNPPAPGAESASRANPSNQQTPPAVSVEEFERLKADRDQLFDRLARLQAEFENARKREARERADFRDFAVANAVEQFLPVLDNFQLALGASGSADQLRAGVDLIVKQMEEVLRSLNVQPVEATGAKFDPRVHEALETVERHDLADNQVLDEVRRGYRIRERLLRPALVRVVSNPQQKEA
ncbi:MAG TPA: nucleotide exchange factor GrpE [Acidobacteriaceae bacterium]|nr:nucleotide exchange factor GrpE [Acidobacteriaceae bacterium]